MWLLAIPVIGLVTWMSSKIDDPYKKLHPFVKDMSDYEFANRIEKRMGSYKETDKQVKDIRKQKITQAKMQKFLNQNEAPSPAS